MSGPAGDWTSGLVRKHPQELQPSPENADLYERFDPDRDPDDRKLVESMQAEGFRDSEPVIVTGDGFILDGHRRRDAALSAGINLLPVIVRSDVRHDTMPHDEYVALLASYNKGTRDKDPEEKVREAIIGIDPDAAHVRLRQRREQRLCFDAPEIDLPEAVRRRSEIGEAKRPMLDACIRIIDELRDYWPLSVRQVHYNLLNDPPPRNANDPSSTYENDEKKKCYKDLSDLLTRARLSGQVRMDAINDETRPVSEWQAWPDAAAYIESQLADLLTDYRRDYMQDQPAHVELIGEKLTVQNVLSRVAYNYGIPLTIGRGWGSLPVKRDLVRRFRASGKQRMVLLIVSDLDPDGDGLAMDYPLALRDDFGLSEDELSAVRVALTHEQVEQYHLRVNGDAEKKRSSRRGAFLEAHGAGDCYELEAVPLPTLERIAAAAVESVIDTEAFEAAREAEKHDAVLIEARRKVILESLRKRGVQ